MKPILKKPQFNKGKKDKALSASERHKITQYISQIESGSEQAVGTGAFKDVYEKDGLVYLREYDICKKATGFYDYQKKVRLLKDYGISIADLIFHTVIPRENKSPIYYEIQERLPGHGVEMFQAPQFVRYMRDKYSKTFENTDSITNYYVPPEIELEMQKENIVALHERATVGQKFLPKVFRDFVILKALNVFDDTNGENILFDERKGYSFIDLDMQRFPSNVNSFEDIETYLKSTYGNRFEFSYHNHRQPNPKDSNSIRTQIYSAFFRGLTQPDCTDFSQGIEAFIFKGIIFHQASQMMLDYANKTNFDNVENIQQAINEFSGKFISLEDLFELKDVLLNGDGTSPHLARTIQSVCWSNHHGVEINENVDFNTQLDCEAFLKAIETIPNPELDYGFKNADNFSMVSDLESTPQ